jgi:hypothetical protein
MLKFTDTFTKIMEFSVSNQNSCVSVGLIDCLLDYFSVEKKQEGTYKKIYGTPDSNHFILKVPRKFDWNDWNLNEA